MYNNCEETHLSGECFCLPCMHHSLFLHISDAYTIVAWVFSRDMVCLGTYFHPLCCPRTVIALCIYQCSVSLPLPFSAC